VLTAGFHVYGKLKPSLGDIENQVMQNISTMAFCTLYRNIGHKATSPLKSCSQYAVHQWPKVQIKFSKFHIHYSIYNNIFSRTRPCQCVEVLQRFSDQFRP